MVQFLLVAVTMVVVPRFEEAIHVAEEAADLKQIFKKDIQSVMKYI